MRFLVTPLIAFFHSRPVTKLTGIVLAFGGFVGLSVDLTPETTLLHYQNIVVRDGEIVLYIGNSSTNDIENSVAEIYGRPSGQLVRSLGSIDELGPESVQYIHFPAGGLDQLPERFYLCIAHDGDYFLDRVTRVIPLVAGHDDRTWFRIDGKVAAERWFLGDGSCADAIAPV